MEDTAGHGVAGAGLRGQRHAVHLEPGHRAHLGQEGHVALAAVAEVEVLPHHHQPGVEALDQLPGDELLGRLVGPLLVEADDHRPVDTGRRQQLELLVEVAEQQRGRLGTHHRGRVAVEGDDHGGQAVVLGPGPQLGQQGPVPEVDAVVGADGDGRAAGGRRQRGAVGHDLHSPEGYCRVSDDRTHAGAARSTPDGRLSRPTR